MARWCSWLTYRPVKAEIGGSSPLRVAILQYSQNGLIGAGSLTPAPTNLRNVSMATADPRVEHMEGVLERISVEQGEIRQDMRQIRQYIRQMDTAMREGDEKLRTEMQAMEAQLRSELQSMETRIRVELNNHQNRVTQMWIGTMGTMVAGFIAVGVAIFLGA